MILTVLFAFLISSLPSQALTTAPITEIKLGKPFKLERGAGFEYLGLYAKGDVKVYFLRVVRDSRCAVGMACLWIGDAEVEVMVKHGLVGKKIILNTFSRTQATKLFGYTIQLRNLKPEKGVRPKVRESVELRLTKS